MHKTVEVLRNACQLCTHTFEGGHVCASPALRGETYCYYHHPRRKKVSNPNERRARRIARQSFTLTNPLNLQLSLNEIMQRLAANQIDPRRAGLLLFALQVAGQNFSAAPPPTGDPLAALMQMLKL